MPDTIVEALRKLNEKEADAEESSEPEEVFEFEDEENFSEDDFNAFLFKAYKKAFEAWKEIWDKDHEEAFPELTDDEINQFIEIFGSVQEEEPDEEYEAEEEKPEDTLEENVEEDKSEIDLAAVEFNGEEVKELATEIVSEVVGPDENKTEEEQKEEIDAAVEAKVEIAAEEKLKSADTPPAKPEELDEDFNSSLPVQALNPQEVRYFIERIPAADPAKPPVFFRLGYMKELTKEIAAKFRGGRGSADQPRVRIVKCTEYSKLYTGVDWRETNATKAADKILGKERHTGEKTGFSFGGDSSVANRIGVYGNNREALQAYIADGSQQKVKYFISLNDEDLREASKDEIAQYLTPESAAKLSAPTTRKAAGFHPETGEAIYDKPINRFYLDQIYMIGDLGHSLF